MNEPPKSVVSPFAQAMQWVAKITTVALEMFVPSVIGAYFGQGWALLGLAVGVTVGIWHLVQMTKRQATKGLAQKQKVD